MKRRRALAAGLIALASPFAANAQAPRLRIGWITFADPGTTLADFRDGLRALGYVAGREAVVELRVVQRDPQAVRSAVEELMRLAVALVVGQGPAAPLVHRTVAGRMAMVFAFSGDPVEAGLVQSFGRPQGNTTGMSFLALDLVGKRMELIKQISPRMKRVAILANPQHPGEKAERRESLAAAERLALQVAYVEFDQARGFESALEAIRRQGCEGLVVFPDSGMLDRADTIASFSLQEHLLCVSGWARFAHSGCLASYGPNLRDAFRRLAHYADRIAQGAHPSSLPVELPARLEMVLNLKTARALGLTVPQALLLRADEVIE